MGIENRVKLKEINYGILLPKINEQYFKLKQTGLTRNKLRNFVLEKFIVFFDDNKFQHVKYYQPQYKGVILPLIWDSCLGFRIYETTREFKLPTTEKNNIFKYINDLYTSLTPENCLKGRIETFVIPKYEPKEQCFYPFLRFSDGWERIER